MHSKIIPFSRCPFDHTPSHSHTANSQVRWQLQALLLLWAGNILPRLLMLLPWELQSRSSNLVNLDPVGLWGTDLDHPPQGLREGRVGDKGVRRNRRRGGTERGQAGQAKTPAGMGPPRASLAPGTPPRCPCGNSPCGRRVPVRWPLPSAWV